LQQPRQRAPTLLLIAGALLALAGGVALAAYLYERDRPYYPVARIASPEGLVYTAFSDLVRGREACAAANQRFLEPFRSDCPGCTVLSERCESREEGMRLRVAESGPVVVSPGVALALSGPRELARATCELIARDLAKRGVERSRCF